VKEMVGRVFYQHCVKAALIYVSADLTKDSQFPFKIPCKVKVCIDGERLIVEVAKGE
jgi:hypothetical protein